MTVTATPYGKFVLGLGTGAFNFSSDTFKAALTTASYVPNVDTHEFFSDVTNEITGTGYTAGGLTLTTVTWTYDSTNNRAVLAADSGIWTTASFTARHAVIYKSTGTAGTSRLVGWIDFGENRTPVAENFVLNFTNGVLRLKVA